MGLHIFCVFLAFFGPEKYDKCIRCTLVKVSHNVVGDFDIWAYKAKQI